MFLYYLRKSMYISPFPFSIMFPNNFGFHSTALTTLVYLYKYFIVWIDGGGAPCLIIKTLTAHIGLSHLFPSIWIFTLLHCYYSFLLLFLFARNKTRFPRVTRSLQAAAQKTIPSPNIYTVASVDQSYFCILRYTTSFPLTRNLLTLNRSTLF